jgi:hypothetical protein
MKTRSLPGRRKLDRSARWIGAPLATFLNLAAATAGARELNVSPSGGSAADGSSANPYPTIQAAADLAVAGDTVVIHNGMYRETVVPANSGTATSPLTFQGATGECAIVTGADRISTSWAPYQGGIYVAALSPAPVNVPQVLVNGQEMILARWPNATPDDLVHMPRAAAGAGTSSAQIVDPQIPAGDWTGATVFTVPGDEWVSWTRKVGKYDQPTRTITFDTPIGMGDQSPTDPRAGSPYYLRGALGLLDAPGEWFYDQAAGKLYLRPPADADPSSLRIEVKTRALAFNLSGRSYVQVQNLRILGAAMGMDSAQHCTIDGVHVRYQIPDGDMNGFATPALLTGGTGNKWINGSVAFSPINGITVSGADHVVQNMLVHDVAYAVGGAGIASNSDVTNANVLIDGNTVLRSGRIGIDHDGVTGGHITHNFIKDVGLLSKDLGFTYAYGTDGKGTEIAYNVGQGNQTTYGNGIYLDDGTTNHVVHHNLVQDLAGFGVFFKNPNNVYNNTVVGAGLQMVGSQPPLAPYDTPVDLSGSVVANNVGTELYYAAQLSTPNGTASKTFPITGDWQTITVPFADLVRPPYEHATDPIDLSQVTDLSFLMASSGTFDVWVDNVFFLAPATGAPFLVDNFDDGDNAAPVGGYWYAAAGANTTTFPASTSTLSVDAVSGHGSAAHLTVTNNFQGWNTLGIGIPTTLDLGQFTAVQLDVRATGQIAIQGQLGNAQYVHDANCPLTAAYVVADACGIDQGEAVPSITDGFSGAAPDLGAFESGQATWTAGSTVDDVAAWSACPANLPESVGGGDAGGSPDAGTVGDAGRSPDAGIVGDAAPEAGAPAASPQGCRCDAGGEGGSTAVSWLLLAAIAVSAARRSRRELVRAMVNSSG